MATASTLQYSSPAGRMAESDHYSSFSMANPPVPGPFSRDFIVAPTSQQQQLAAGSSPPPPAPHDSAVYAARTVSTHGKLHKRVDSLGALPKRRTSMPQPRVDTSVASSTPPMSSPKSPHSKSMSKDKLRHSLSLKKVPQYADEDNQLDLSKTTEENEEKSGLGISTPSRSASEVNFFPGAALSNHNRSVSYASLQSSTSASFKPSAPFVIPERSSPRPEQDSFEDSTVEDSDVSGDAYYGLTRTHDDVLEDDGVLSPLSQTVTAPLPPLQQYPSPTSSRSTSRMASPSQTNLSMYTTSTSITRPRRSTNQSLDTVATAASASKSRASVDKALSFMSRPRHPSEGVRRGSANDSPTMDPIERHASIQAARKAFAEREAAEERKHEALEQKRAARRDSKPRWSQGLRNRSLTEPLSMRDRARPRRNTDSHPASSPRAAPLPPVYPIGREYDPNAVPATPPIPVDGPRSNAAPLPSKAPLFVKLSDQQQHHRRTSAPRPASTALSLDSRPAAAPAAVRAGQATGFAGLKHRCMRLLTWLKIRLLKAGKSKARFQGRTAAAAATPATSH